MSIINPSGKSTVAYCFYGQYRTADYTMPWLKAMVDNTPTTEYVGCSTKITNAYPNSLHDTPVVFTHPEEAKAKLEVAFPDIDMDVSNMVHKRLDPQLGHWHYARMIWSMNKSLQMYNAWADQHGDVDIIVLARLDALVGPSPDDLGRFLMNQKPTWRDIWTSPGVTHFVHSELGLGVGDLLIAGTPTSINCLLSYAAGCLTTNPRKGWTRYRHGPNIMFKDAIDAASLFHRQIPVRVALVRPSADLNVPVMDSFLYHQKFWTETHNSTKR